MTVHYTTGNRPESATPIAEARAQNIDIPPLHSYNETDLLSKSIFRATVQTGGGRRMKGIEPSFQDQVEAHLIRHRSILDVLSKLQESAARVNRSVVKAVTSCGCITIDASKQEFPSDVGLTELKAFLASHLTGSLCERCREAIETEIGSALFYSAGLCSLLDLKLDEILEKQHSRIKSLGIFNLT